MKQIGSNLEGPSNNNMLRGSKDEAPPPESRKQTGSKRKQRAQGSVLPHLLSPLWGEYKEALSALIDGPLDAP